MNKWTDLSGKCGPVSLIKEYLLRVAYTRLFHLLPFENAELDIHIHVSVCGCLGVFVCLFVHVQMHFAGYFKAHTKSCRKCESANAVQQIELKGESINTYVYVCTVLAPPSPALYYMCVHFE